MSLTHGASPLSDSWQPPDLGQPVTLGPAGGGGAHWQPLLACACRWPAPTSAPCGLLDPLPLRLVAGSLVMPGLVLLSSLTRSFPAWAISALQKHPRSKDI